MRACKHVQIIWELKVYAYDTKAPLPSQVNSPYGRLCIFYYLKTAIWFRAFRSVFWDFRFIESLEIWRA